jgi:hypothetical protein
MSGQKLEQLTAQLAALREIGRAINAAWELEATLDLITCRTAEVMDMDSCSIYLLDGGGERLLLKATTGLSAEAVGQVHLLLGEGLTGWAAQTGQPVAVADAAQDPRFKFLPETQETRFQSLLALIADLAARKGLGRETTRRWSLGTFAHHRGGAADGGGRAETPRRGVSQGGRGPTGGADLVLCGLNSALFAGYDAKHSGSWAMRTRTRFD